MYLREVLLKNWRSYKSAQFTFPAPREKKKVVLVGAMNGTGKTSLLMGLYLGLFGRSAMMYLEGIRLSDQEGERQQSYRTLMERILHRGALEYDDPQASVQLVFDLEEQVLVITRTWNYRRGGTLRDISGLNPEGEEVRIEWQGRVSRFKSWEEANVRIEELLFPAHVLPCFFFDGEQAQERVESSGGEGLAQAIQALYGTKLLEQLEDTLQTYVNNKRQTVKREVGDVREDELDQKRSALDELNGKVKSLRRELATVKADLEVVEATRKARIQELTTVGGDALVDAQFSLQQQKELQQLEQQHRDELCRQISGLALPIAFRRLRDQVLKQLEGEIIRDRWLILYNETSSKAEDILNRSLPEAGSSELEPPLTDTQREQLSKRIRSAIESIWSPPPDGCVDAHRFSFLTPSDRQNTLTRADSVAGRGASDLLRLMKQWQEARNDFEDSKKKWESIRDIQPRVQEIKARIDELNTRVTDLNSKKSNLETLDEGYSKEIGDLRSAIGQMEAKKQKRGPEESRIDQAQRVREVLQEVHGQLRPLCIQALEDRCTAHFREMISGEYRTHRIEFDNENQPRLVNGSGDHIYVTTLSGAQKRAFGLAFTLAIAEVSGQEAPLVIDTPVGNMDSEFRKRILKYLARSAPGQLIFLSHDEEIYGEFTKELEPSVIKRYLISFQQVREGTGISVLQEGKYFQK